MRQAGDNGALLTLGWVLMAAYVAAVMLVTLALQGLKALAASLPRGRWTPVATAACGVAVIFSALVWRREDVLYPAAAGLILGAVWGLLGERQEVDHA